MTKIYRYAQKRGGQKLHLVEDWGYGRVELTALCGRSAVDQGRWRMTINVPLGHACKRCLTAFARIARP